MKKENLYASQMVQSLRTETPGNEAREDMQGVRMEMGKASEEITEELFENPAVIDGKHVQTKEIYMLDGNDHVEVLAWNSIPTYYVRVLRTKAMIEVEPWRIKKIEKVD